MISDELATVFIGRMQADAYRLFASYLRAQPALYQQTAETYFIHHINEAKDMLSQVINNAVTVSINKLPMDATADELGGVWYYVDGYSTENGIADYASIRSKMTGRLLLEGDPVRMYRLVENHNRRLRGSSGD
jgi:hypothetical protein